METIYVTKTKIWVFYLVVSCFFRKFASKNKFMKVPKKIGVWVKLRGFLSMLCLYRSNCVVNFVLFNLAFCGLLYNFAPQSEA